MAEELKSGAEEGKKEVKEEKKKPEERKREAKILLKQPKKEEPEMKEAPEKSVPLITKTDTPTMSELERIEAEADKAEEALSKKAKEEIDPNAEAQRRWMHQ